MRVSPARVADVPAMRLRLPRARHSLGGCSDRGTRTAPAALPAPSPHRGAHGVPPSRAGTPGTPNPLQPGLTGSQEGAEGERKQRGGAAAHDRGSALWGCSWAFPLLAAVPAVPAEPLEPEGVRQVFYSPGPARHPLRPRGTPGSRGAGAEPPLLPGAILAFLLRFLCPGSSAEKVPGTGKSLRDRDAVRGQRVPSVPRAGLGLRGKAASTGGSAGSASPAPAPPPAPGEALTCTNWAEFKVKVKFS